MPRRQRVRIENVETVHPSIRGRVGVVVGLALRRNRKPRRYLRIRIPGLRYEVLCLPREVRRIKP